METFVTRLCVRLKQYLLVIVHDISIWYLGIHFPCWIKHYIIFGYVFVEWAKEEAIWIHLFWILHNMFSSFLLDVSNKWENWMVDYARHSLHVTFYRNEMTHTFLPNTIKYSAVQYAHTVEYTIWYKRSLTFAALHVVA